MIDTPSRHEIWKMFDAISPTYDRVNRVMTSGFDRYWRKKMAERLPAFSKIRLLDIASGTGDQIFFLMDRVSTIDQAIGTDLAKEMLRIAKQKLKTKSYADKITFQEADALQLPFEDNAFECATISFGIRNVIDVSLCLREMARVIKKGGKALILEASLPKNPFLRKGHLFYLRHLLPRIGGFLSKNRAAYCYLNQTIETFPSGQAFCDLMLEAGFKSATAYPLTFGSVTIYEGMKE